MRIKGLVRAVNNVRTQLQAGLKPEEVEQFRERVKTIVREVEEICRTQGVTPDQLPAPSRMAYVYLKRLDLDNLTVIQAGENVESASVFRVKNVVKIGDHFARRLWQQLDLLLSSSSDRDQLKRDLGEHVSAIERICEQHDVTPSAMETPSRQTYCWLKFLSSEDNLASHLDTLQRTRDDLNHHQPRLSQPVHLHLIVMNALWRKRHYRNAVLLKVNEGFLYADQNVWRAIIDNAIYERDPDNDLLIREYVMTDDFGELLFEIDSFAAPPALPTRGRAHDLDESFNRVNREYFDDQMAKPNLVWNRTLTMRKFGQYQPGRDTLMVSITLDDPQVPMYVIDFVIYHELLHKKHGAMMVNGRRQVHSPGFRADERRFKKFDEATHHLKSLALRQRGSE
ncbi:MAG: hypothetical protein MOB07_20285 [Acidobacteria bacterium]|nr:hypothetical protein [Acidobacteriota bacterium]